MKKGVLFLVLLSMIFLGTIVSAWPTDCTSGNYVQNVGSSARCSNYGLSGGSPTNKCMSGWCGPWYCDSMSGKDTYICCKGCSPECVANCACAADICAGQTCANGCGGTCAGTKGVSSISTPFNVDIPMSSFRIFGISPDIFNANNVVVTWTDHNSKCNARITVNPSGLISPSMDVDSTPPVNIGSLAGAFGTVSSVRVAIDSCNNEGGTHVSNIAITGCRNSYTCVPSAEICDGMDNNCNNQADEGNVCSRIDDTYWANLKGDKISSSNVNDTVLMMVPGERLDAPEINYSIIKEGEVTWNPLNWFDHTILKTSSLGISDWKIYLGGTFHFIARVNGLTNQSASLPVANSESDSSPTVLITLPVSEYKISVNYPLAFTHSSSDEDDLLRLTWDFGDGRAEIFNNYSLALTPGLGDIFHNYSSPGTYQIKLTASEPGRANPKSSSDYKTIYVLQPGINVISIINSPTSSTSYGNWVNFNASKSFVVNCTRGPLTPTNFIAGDLNCSYLHNPVQKTITGNYDLRLNWTVYDSAGRMERGFPRIGSWKNNYSYIVEYPIYFEEAKKRNAILSITYS
jgi:hypothetical protein